MEMNRRIGAGRLSGSWATPPSPSTSSSAPWATAHAAGRPGGHRAAQPPALDAYAEGVNQWLSEGHTLPPEFILLGVSPEPWQPTRWSGRR